MVAPRHRLGSSSLSDQGYLGFIRLGMVYAWPDSLVSRACECNVLSDYFNQVIGRHESTVSFLDESPKDVRIVLHQLEAVLYSLGLALDRADCVMTSAEQFFLFVIWVIFLEHLWIGHDFRFRWYTLGFFCEL